MIQTSMRPLQEPDSLLLGDYVFSAVAADDRIVVSDMTNGSLALYDPEGRFVRRFGRLGAGPGELRRPRAVAILPGDSIVGVNDLETQRLSFFDLRSGRHIGSVRGIGRELGVSWPMSDDTIYAAVNAADHRLQKWTLGMDSAIGLAPTPAARLAEIFTVLQHGRAEVADAPDGLLVLAETATDRLLLIDRAGVVKDSMVVPSVRRTGAPPDLIERARAQQARRDPDDTAPLGSTLAGFGRLDDSLHVIVWLDVGQVAAASGRPGGGRMIFGDYHMYVTLIDLARRRACVDGAVPVGTDMLPVVSVRDGRLHLLTRASEASEQVRITLHTYRLDPAPCQWLPLSTAGSEVGP